MSKKRILVIASAMAFVITSIATSRAVNGASASPASYTLVCKGGGRMTANLFEGSGRMYLQINFRKASAAASVSQPGPGEVAWVDRPLDPGEPTRMIFWIGSIRPELSIGLNWVSINNWYGDKTTDVKYLIRAIQYGELFYVQAHLHDPGASAFIIDRVGP